MNNPGQPLQNLGGGFFFSIAPVRAPRAQLQQPVQNAAALLGVAINGLPAAISPPAPLTPGAQPYPAGEAVAAVPPDLQVPAAPAALARNLLFQFDQVAAPALAGNPAFAPSTPSQSGTTPPP